MDKFVNIKKKKLTIKEFFKQNENSEKKVALGSIKSQIGHAFSAAGMANLIKVLEGLRRKKMPPTFNFTKLPMGESFDNTALYINTKLKEWKTKDDKTPRRAMVNAFGFGGINANILLEEYVCEYYKDLYIEDTKSNDCDVSIVGVGCFDFISNNKTEWWNNVKNNFVIEPKNIQDNRWNEVVKEIYKEQKGFYIDKINFPFIKFKIPPATLKQIDKSQQIALISASEAIEDYGKEKITESKTGVYIGNMLGLESALNTDLRVRHVEYLYALEKNEVFNTLDKNEKNEIINKITKSFRNYIAKVEEDTLPGYMDNVIAGRIANFYNIKGANEICDCDVVSFSAALYQGIMSLKIGENDVAIVGAVNANMMPELCELLSKDGVNKEILKRKYGELVPAEGALFLYLKKVKMLQVKIRCMQEL